MFGRPIGKNQGIHFPLARTRVHVAAANLMPWRVADAVTGEAANTALQTHARIGFVAEYDI